MDATDGARYGVFQLGSMQLALHLDALREVVPRGPCIALPCGNPAVIGGVDLRGLLVPVLDLRHTLQQARTGQPANVVIMCHEGHLLGLLVDSVTGVFECAPERLHAFSTQTGGQTLFDASFAQPETGALICVLSPERVSRLPDVPRLREPERRAGSEAGRVAALDYVMLTRCGRLRLALPSGVVHSTVLNPEVRSSALSGGCCLGTVEVAGRQIAAIDLGALCGLGSLAGRRQQAFVIAYAEHLLAFLVDEITDVRPAELTATLPVPPSALPRPELFAGALPAQALQDRPGAYAGSSADVHLLLDAETLRSLPELERLARMNTGAAARQASAARQEASAAARAGQPDKVLTYELGGAQAATPLEQIAEILPWNEQAGGFGTAGTVMGLLMSRGRAIPTYNLAGLLGRAADARHAPAGGGNVLVIEREQWAVGFAVPRLIGIDAVHWMPPQDLQSLQARAATARPGGGPELCWGRVMVDDEAGQRMLGLLDLRHLAGQLQSAQA